MASFADIAAKRLADVERPPLPPKGMYRWQVAKIPEISEMAAGAFEKVSFVCKAVEAYNVDEDDLKAFGGTKNVALPLEFIFDKNDDTKFAQTEFRLKSFIEKHIKVEGAEEMTMMQSLNAAVNCQFDAMVDWQQDKNDKELFYARMGKTAPVRE